MVPVGLAEVPSLYRLARFWMSKFGWTYKRGVVLGGLISVVTLGTFLRYVCQVSDCPNRLWQMQDLGWCLFSSGQSRNWRPAWGCIAG